MKKKEKPNQQLEKSRGMFFNIGFIVACGLTLMAFEWTFPNYTSELKVINPVAEGEFELPPITWTEVEKPKVVKKEKITESKHKKIKVVNNNTQIEKKNDLTNQKTTVNLDSLLGKLFTEEKVKEEKVYVSVEQMPVFKGGEDKLFKYLKEKLNYDERARKAHIQGTVYVQFIVGKKGEIRDVTIRRGVHKWLDNEALRVVKAMPKWKPGKQGGKRVSVKYTLPIAFKIK